MYPGALLTDIGDLHHIRIQTGRLCSLTESSLVHTGRAGTDNNTGKAMFPDCVADDILTGLGTHILIVGGENNTGLIFERLCHCDDVYSAGDIASAPAYEYSDSLHLRFLPYLVYFRNALTIAC